MTSTPEPPARPDPPNEPPKRIAQSWILDERRELTRNVRDVLVGAMRGENPPPARISIADWLEYDAQLEALMHLVNRAPNDA